MAFAAIRNAESSFASPLARSNSAAARVVGSWKNKATHKMADPLYSRFMQQRHGAKQRGIGWQLEYWEWLQIWEESGHLHERGNRAGQWVMGRNGDRGPYAIGNVKIIRVEMNNREASLSPNRLKQRMRRIRALKDCRLSSSSK
jgi:hypothetical protein